MTTSADIRTLWNTQVLQDATIQAITDRTFSYDIAILTSKNENDLKYEQEINFFTLVVLRSIAYGETAVKGSPNSYSYMFEVRIDYYREALGDGTAYNAAIDNMDTLNTVILTNLGLRWDSNVDNSRQSNTQLPELVDIQGIQVWKSSVLWTGWTYN